MKTPVLGTLLFILTGCGSTSAPPPMGSGGSQWYQAGYHDALAGKIVRDNNQLAEWYGNPQVDRDAYLKGYNAGQVEICLPDKMTAIGEQGRKFPAACDLSDNAEQLRQEWQKERDKGSP
ncbi:DUF2799 domain-containing protein [Acerihabitans sp. KWT182]|uniref:DUF2799 domain-containing protein n=1 Tax=Acerihabitans sp. KWT182 TaxID=3157919 RepID=A0AAU7QCR2_9GAMM